MTFLMLGLERGAPGDRAKAAPQGRQRQNLLQSHPKEPVVSIKLPLIQNRACKPGCPASKPRSETASSKPRSFKLFIRLHFSSFVIDLRGPFLRAPLVPTWLGSWLFASLTPGMLPFSCKTAQHQLSAQCPPQPRSSIPFVPLLPPHTSHSIRAAGVLEQEI